MKKSEAVTHIKQILGYLLQSNPDVKVFETVSNDVIDYLAQNGMLRDFEPEVYEITEESLRESLSEFKINGKSVVDMFGNKLISSIIAHSIRS